MEEVSKGVASRQVEADTIPSSELLLLDRSEELTYEIVTNYARATKGSAQLCVMCGNMASKGPEDNEITTVIPRQNKDVCRDCDKAIWHHEATSAYFKWCKGCKNFLQIGNFSQKLDAAKCDKCRERGRTSYLLKKRIAPTTPSTATSSTKKKVNKHLSAQLNEKEPCPCLEEPIKDCAAANSLVALFNTGDCPSCENKPQESTRLIKESPPEKRILSQSFGCSLSKTPFVDEANPQHHDITNEEPGGLLFELANIHSTILKLEQQADRVPTLENQVNDLKTQLSAALDREELLKARIAILESSSTENSSDEGVQPKPKKRPRLISFDDAAISSHS